MRISAQTVLRGHRPSCTPPAVGRRVHQQQPAVRLAFPAARFEAPHPVTARVRDLDAEGVADDVQEQAEVTAGEASVDDGVGGRLGDEERGRVQRQPPDAELLGGEQPGRPAPRGVEDRRTSKSRRATPGDVKRVQYPK
ncbi:hypothetical protein QF032_004667 [Streptomyces achromogenes]|nr:hypothetical protein [Streptomyces achromogenes]